MKRHIWKYLHGAVRIAAALALLLGPIFVHVLPASAAPGDSAGDPIIIANCSELQAIDSNTANYSKHYALDSDINCVDSASWNGGKGFDPIASDGQPFTGTFNGRHHTITNLTINRANDTPGRQNEDDEQSVGLFAWTQDATISNLNIDTSKVKGYAFVGGIVGWAEDTALTNVSFNATVADNDCNPGHCVWARYGYDGGGLVGMLHRSTIVNGVTAGPVKGSGNTIGGLVGQMGDNSSVTSSSSSSNIDGGNQLGGAVGDMLGGTLHDVHASGSVIATTEEDFKSGYAAGGLVGQMEGAASVTRSSATGDVHADWQAAGGLVGLKEGTGAITDAYARGNITQTTGWTEGGSVGGLIGDFNDGVVERTYASGSVTGEYRVGGLVGSASGSDENTTIRDSFAAGRVTQTGEEDDPFDGGLIGQHYPWSFTIHNNYYDTDKTAMDHCYGWYPEGYAQSDATIAGKCIARNTDDIPNPTYFYNPNNQPFNDGEGQVWSTSTWDFHEDNYPTFECDQCEVIEDQPADTTAPVITGLTPADNATNVPVDTATITLTFNEPVFNGSSVQNNKLIIKKVSDNSIVYEMRAHETLVNISGNTVTFDLVTLANDEFEPGTAYYVQFQNQTFRDAAGNFHAGINDATTWNFTTSGSSQAPDDDNDGITTEVENAAPNNGDGNNDETPDSEQANVASFVNPITSTYVTVAVDDACTLSAVSAANESTNAAQDEGFVYNSGLVNFTADCGEDGFTTPVSVYHYGVNKDGLIVRKYNPNTQAYFTINDASLSQETIASQSVTVATYSITDGGNLDVDGEENGTIVDPVGLAATATSTQGAGVNDLASTGKGILPLILLAMGSIIVSVLYLKTRRNS